MKEVIHPTVTQLRGKPLELQETTLRFFSWEQEVLGNIMGLAGILIAET